MSDFDNEKWFALYRSAVLELEQIKMTGRIADARVGIADRLEALRYLPGLHTEEHIAITDALRVLKTLEREAARLAEEQASRLATEALEMLKPIEARIGKTN